jgi:magnesium transporter
MAVERVELFMTHEEQIKLVDGIRPFLDLRDDGAVREYLLPLHSSEIASIFNGIAEEEAAYIFRLLEPDVAGEVMLEVDERLREKLISVITPSELVEVVEEMETDDAADVIGELPAEDARQVLEGIAWKEAVEVERLMRYAEDTAGGKMQAELVAVHEDATVDDAINEVRRRREDVGQVPNVFVVNRSNELVGVVSLESLILSSGHAPVKTIADHDPVKASTDLDQEEVAKLFRRYDLVSMPVVDSHNRLVGRITVDDVVDVIEEEIFEDFYRMAGLNVEERALDTPIRSFRMRAPWLLLNLATAFFAASVVKAFEGAIETLVALAALMPVVAGLGGNAATQAITVVIRGLALGEVHSRNSRRVLVKEAIVGLANGVVVGAVAGLVAYVVGAGAMLGVVLFLAMTINLIIAGVGGAVIPLMLRWLKADPALSASIFVTACTDSGGFLTFLGLASVFMKAGLL